jgi:lysylphosphatidylglycerol synthetase-like protein (DUF2156 family)
MITWSGCADGARTRIRDAWILGPDPRGDEERMMTMGADFMRFALPLGIGPRFTGTTPGESGRYASK